MPRYNVTISATYEVEAESEEDAYYLALGALKEDLPENEAPLDFECNEVKDATRVTPPS